MRRWGYALSVLLLAASLLAGGRVSRAEDVTPEQAQALTAQLREWLAFVVGPGAKLPDLRIVPAGDHYTLSVPHPWLEGPDTQITASLRPLDGGRWAVDDVRFPAAGELSLKLPAPKDEAGRAGAGDVRVRYSVGDQDAHAIIDPTLATPSTIVSIARDVVIDTLQERQQRTQRVGSITQKVTLRPAADGKLDVDTETEIEDSLSTARTPDGETVTTSSHHEHGTGHAVGVDRGQSGALTAAFGALINAPTPDRTDPARALVRSMRGLMTSMTMQISVDGVRTVGTDGGTTTIDTVQVGLNIAAPAGKVATDLTVGLDGLKTTDLPPSAADLAPKHADIDVSLSGLPGDAVENLALAALQPGANANTLAPQIDALFAASEVDGGPQFGIKTLNFDVGPALVQGHGALLVASKSDLHGAARITVTGFDALADRLRADPDLQRTLPFLVLARGLARAEGTALVWDIAFTPEAVTVNGIDPRALAQATRPRPARPQP